MSKEPVQPWARGKNCRWLFMSDVVVGGIIIESEGASELTFYSAPREFIKHQDRI